MKNKPYVARQVVIREEGTIFYGDREMNTYRRGPALHEGSCPEVTRIGLGDQNTYNRLFPPSHGNE